MRFSKVLLLSGLVTLTVSQNVPNVLIYGWAGSMKTEQRQLLATTPLLSQTGSGLT
jgi:hypothetical protein